jgi:hypothetical protein
MTDNISVPRTSIRLGSALALSGQLAYVAVTQLHAGGHANEHHEIFETYAHNGIWGAVHLGQFLAMAMIVAGLVVLARALAADGGAAQWPARFASLAASASLALYAALQAVDGVALKQAVSAWTAAPEAEQVARFAAAESIRWLEWGMRSYQDYLLGLAVVSLAAAMYMAGRVPRVLALIAGLCGAAYLAQGWIAGAEGFSASQSIAIVAGWVFGALWMSWLAFVAWGPERAGNREALAAA